MSYDHFIHRHNFAAWAAARAAQRNWKGAKVASLKAAIEQCGVVEFLRRSQALEIGREEFDGLHRIWCIRIQEYLAARGVARASHGRAAKMIAVYLKAMVIVGSASDSRLAHVAHPPVDHILLLNMARDIEIACPEKMQWSRLKWTRLEADAYYHLIDQLRECLNEGEPMWLLEKYWTVT